MTVRYITLTPKCLKQNDASFLYYYLYLLCKSFKELFLLALVRGSTLKVDAKVRTFRTPTK